MIEDESCRSAAGFLEKVQLLSPTGSLSLLALGVVGLTLARRWKV